MDEVGYAFFFGIFIGACVIVMFFMTPAKTYVDQGFLESQGKIYTVTLADVVARKEGK